MEASEHGIKTIIRVKCKFCNTKHHIVVDTEDYVDYMNTGKLIQNCFPYLSLGDRELIISETCEKCFDDIMKDLENGNEPELCYE